MNPSWYIVFAALLFVSMIGASLAFGEEFEDNIKIPVPSNVTGVEKKANLSTLSENLLEFTITYRFHLGENGTQWYEEILEKYTIGEPVKTNSTDIVPEVVIDMTPDFMKPFEQDYENFLDDPPLRPSDKEYFELLKALAECERGINQSLGVFKQDRFAVSQTWINDAEAYLKGYDLTGRHAQLLKAIEECQAIHTKLNPVVLGAQYANLAEQYNVTEPYHADAAFGIPPISQEYGNKVQNEGIEQPVFDQCSSLAHYSNWHKLAFCGEEDSDGSNEFKIVDMTAFCTNPYVTPEKKMELGECTEEQLSLFVDVGQHSNVFGGENSPLAAWSDYKYNGDAAQYEKNKKQSIEETFAKFRR